MRLHDYDIAVLVKLLWGQVEPHWTYRSLGAALKLSPSSVLKAVERTSFAGLYRQDTRRPLRPALMEFLVHGLKYAFPVKPGELRRGIATAISHPAIKAKFVMHDDDIIVWPSSMGDIRGQMILPLLPWAHLEKAIQSDESFYLAMALVECLRIGRKRESELAADMLKKMETHHGKA